MSTARACFLIGAFSLVAITAVHLRAEQTRCASELAHLESRWVALRREWWDLQTRTARIKTPVHLRERVERLRADLVSPESEHLPGEGFRLASDLAE